MHHSYTKKEKNSPKAVGNIVEMMDVTREGEERTKSFTHQYNLAENKNPTFS